MAGGDDHVTHLALSEGTLPEGSLPVDLGPGNDEFKGADGRETVDGGPGNDTISGGPGDDVLAANDGRPGEGDDVRDVERITSHVSGTFVFGDAPNTAECLGDPDYGDGCAGGDRLEGGYGDDTIVGGPGRDRRVIKASPKDGCG